MPTILSIEDGPEMHMLYRVLLSRHNFKVVGALGGAEALSKIADVRPDVILLDLMLPDMSGWEVLRRIKDDDLIRAIPVIVVSALSRESERAHAAETGLVADFVAKPFTPQELVDSILRVLAE